MKSLSSPKLVALQLFVSVASLSAQNLSTPVSSPEIQENRSVTESPLLEGFDKTVSETPTASQTGSNKENATDCPTLGLSIEKRIKNDHSKLLELVEAEVKANPSCACEVVKSAIKASEATPMTVADIVEVAITAAPDSMRLISQCAIAIAPDSLADVQAVLAKLDPNRGESGTSAKSAKSAKGDAKETAAEAAPNQVPDPANPLNRNFTPIIVPGLINVPNTIDPPVVTDVD